MQPVLETADDDRSQKRRESGRGTLSVDISRDAAGGMADWVLAIDFGTSFTTAAARSGSRPEMIEIDGEIRIPSNVFIDGDTVVVGKAAEQLGRVRPQNAVRELKRHIGEPAPIVRGNHAF